MIRSSGTHIWQATVQQMVEKRLEAVNYQPQTNVLKAQRYCKAQDSNSWPISYDAASLTVTSSILRHPYRNLYAWHAIRGNVWSHIKLSRH